MDRAVATQSPRDRTQLDPRLASGTHCVIDIFAFWWIWRSRTFGVRGRRGVFAGVSRLFIKLGLGGCDIGTSYFLPRLVGVSVASELILTGRFIGAERAMAVGLVSEVVDEDKLDAAAEPYVEAMMMASPVAMAVRATL